MLIREIIEADIPPMTDRMEQMLVVQIPYFEGDMDQLEIEFRIANNHDPYDDDVTKEHEDFDEWLRGFVYERGCNFLDHMHFMFKGGRLPIYRVITAPADWQPDPNRHPGVCWSWDKHAAEAHQGHFGQGYVEWMMEASVTSDQIDWDTTICLNVAPSSESEKEIRILSENTPIKIEKFYHHGRR